MNEAVTYERRGPVAWLTINRPEARNDDSDARVLVLTSAHRAGKDADRWPPTLAHC